MHRIEKILRESRRSYSSNGKEVIYLPPNSGTIDLSPLKVGWGVHTVLSGKYKGSSVLDFFNMTLGRNWISQEELDSVTSAGIFSKDGEVWLKFKSKDGQAELSRSFLGRSVWVFLLRMLFIKLKEGELIDEPGFDVKLFDKHDYGKVEIRGVKYLYDGVVDEEIKLFSKSGEFLRTLYSAFYTKAIWKDIKKDLDVELKETYLDREEGYFLSAREVGLWFIGAHLEEVNGRLEFKEGKKKEGYPYFCIKIYSGPFEEVKDLRKNIPDGKYVCGCGSRSAYKYAVTWASRSGEEGGPLFNYYYTCPECVKKIRGKVNGVIKKERLEEAESGRDLTFEELLKAIPGLKLRGAVKVIVEGGSNSWVCCSNFLGLPDCARERGVKRYQVMDKDGHTLEGMYICLECAEKIRSL